MNALKKWWQSGFLGKMVVLGMLIFALGGCSGVGTAQRELEKQQSTPTTVVGDNTKATDVPTAEPSFTLTPTEKPRPTDTRTPPTDTPRPTKTPTPTNTPIPPTDTPQPTSTQTPTKLPVATNTRVPTQIPTPELPEATGSLLNLKPANFKAAIQSHGFACAEPIAAASLYIWRCSKSAAPMALEVIFYGKAVDTVDLIDASIMREGGPSNDAAIEFLSSMAAIAYSDSLPDAAKAWIAETVPALDEAGNPKGANFNGVPFNLFVTPSAKAIELGTMPAP